MDKERFEKGLAIRKDGEVTLTPPRTRKRNIDDLEASLAGRAISVGRPS